MKKLLVATVFLAVTFGSIAVGTSVAEAKSVQCDLAGSCKVFCTQNLPNGGWVEYEEGTVITVHDTDGKEYKFKCVNGEWVKQAFVGPGAGLFGQITPVGIGPIKIAPDETGYGGLNIRVLEGADPVFLSRRPIKSPGCDPNTVGCPG